MPLNIGPMEVAIVLVIALIVFGPKRLPELGNSLGRSMHEFKSSITGNGRDEESPLEETVDLDAVRGHETA